MGVQARALLVMAMIWMFERNPISIFAFICVEILVGLLEIESPR